MERRTPLRRKTPLKRQSAKAIKWDADGICKHGRRRGDCRSCISSRNKAFGQSVQREMHQALGGTGPTPHNEESGRGYIIDVVADDGLLHPNIMVHPEAKGGQQIPASFIKAFGTDWWRRSLSQSQRSLPIGMTAKPAVWLHLPGGHRYLIVDYGGGRG